MQNHNRQNPAPGLGLADIYYILFRNKWKMLGFFAAGILAAALTYRLSPQLYISEAELFIRYVQEARVPTGVGGDTPVRTPDPAGANIINSEMEIIKSADLALQVVRAPNIGAEMILGTGKTNDYDAAGILRKGLKLESPPRSDILRISFQNEKRWIVQPVLTELIKVYITKHFEIHRSGFDEFLEKQRDDFNTALGQKELELKNAMANTNLMSIEDAGLMSIQDMKKAYTEQISRLRELVFNTQAELTQRTAALKEHLGEVSTNQTDAPVPPAKTKEYSRVSARLEYLRKNEEQLMTQYAEGAKVVRDNRDKIEAAESAQQKLLEEYPSLAKLQPGAPRDWSEDQVQIKALQAKLILLTNHLNELISHAKTVNELEPTISALQRKRDEDQSKFSHFSTSLEQAKLDKDLSVGKSSNISVAQNATVPMAQPKAAPKILAMIVGAGVFGGIGLAFVLELFFDPTIRRPVEIETRLRLPLFLTIPDTRRNGHLRLPTLPRLSRFLPAWPKPPNDPGTDLNSAGGALVAPHPSEGLLTYYEALRDRLVTSFEISNLTHKPKLVALTGCSTGVGVTTIATGLAASLSETGDGNVLLVDMTNGKGSAHPFFKGKPACGLTDVLQGEKPESAMVQENLYMAREGGNGNKLSCILPQRFSSLVPKLKASDYDYIIFDMPPVSQISITPRLAGFMDMVLLVIESEKTDREVVKRATAMLAESKANVGAVLNKNYAYVPRRLQQDL